MRSEQRTAIVTFPFSDKAALHREKPGSGYQTKGDFIMKDQKSRKPASVDNIYKLDGRVPIAKAIPFGLQHVLAMFVAMSRRSC